MPLPHIPTPLEQLGNRPFSFYPAIVNVEHNEWIFRRSDWEDLQVMNTKTREELWIPRRFLSGVSSIEEPVVIVGLLKELEYREGIVVPHVRRIIEMPRAVNDIVRPSAPARPQPGQLAPVVGIRLESEETPSRKRPLLATISAGILTCIVGLTMYRATPSAVRGRFFPTAAHIALPFSPQDDYLAVVSRIGRPSWTDTVTAPNGVTLHLLGYPDRGYTLVLAGEERDQALYAGALGRRGGVIHSVKLSNGGDSAAMLSSIGR